MRILTIAAAVIVAMNLSAQATIKYDVEMEANDPEMQSQVAMMEGSTMQMFMEGDKFSQIMNMGDGLMKTTTTIDNDENRGLILTSGMMGKKAITFDNDTREEDQEEPDIELLNDTKEILGFVCKKAIVYGEGESEITYWYTEEIDQPSNSTKYMSKKIPGMPLEFSVGTPQLTMKFVATEHLDHVENPDEVFNLEVPEGYTEETMEEMQKKAEEKAKAAQGQDAGQ
ncbi:MAG: hypothetical protein ACQERC_13195 [Bacteroidota bacterium]